MFLKLRFTEQILKKNPANNAAIFRICIITMLPTFVVRTLRKQLRTDGRLVRGDSSYAFAERVWQFSGFPVITGCCSALWCIGRLSNDELRKVSDN